MAENILTGITEEEIKTALAGLGQVESEADFNGILARVLSQLATKIIEKAKN